MNKMLLSIFSFSLISCFMNENNNKIIISLTSDINSIKKTILVINSIIVQNVDINYYEILLILSYNEFKNVNDLPNEIQLLHNLKKIRLLFIKEKLTNQSSALIAMKEYKNNAILLINNKCLLPNGWLEMFIKDHKKYPKEAIAASIQYYFGKHGEIKELSEGYKGDKFGTFNHVTEMIFNFALVNKDFGGILYPKNFFQNISFYDQELFFKTTNNTDEFWQSAFIIMEDKILRQSSKIFDYTRYLLNDINYEDIYNNKTELYETIKKSFSLSFPDFVDSIKKRQNKIIVSFTSYPKRFSFLPVIITFIRNQLYHINKIKLFLYEDDIKYYNLNISEIEIISVDKNLMPHKKYFYAMKSFRDHAIITIDDDFAYAADTFQSLFNAYIENPNIISGRRGHLIKYKNNGELKKYDQWTYEQRLIKEPNFDLSLTNGASSIFPPDILNIKDDFLPIINETLTCDDLTLKYFSVLKAIPHKWIVNNNINGVSKRLPKSESKPLFLINALNNDICLNKLDITINNTMLKNICVKYKNIPTGNSIYLFNIHNKTTIDNKFFFNVYAYSYCPIDYTLTFNISFDQSLAFCSFNESKKIFENEINLTIASCYMNEVEYDLDFYFFPKAISENDLLINIANYRKYLTIIFKSFICQDFNICILKVILLEQLYIFNFELNLNNHYYLCNLEKNSFYQRNIFPIIVKYKCYFSKIPLQNNNNLISGIPININITKRSNDNIIPNSFIISRIVKDNEDGKNEIIIIGNLINDFKGNLYNFSINFLYPNLTLYCNLSSYSKYVLSKIHCINHREIPNEILIENQIIYSQTNNEELLLINKETLIKLDFNKTNHLLFTNKRKERKFSFIINILLLFLFTITKLLKKYITKKEKRNNRRLLRIHKKRKKKRYRKKDKKLLLMNY